MSFKTLFIPLVTPFSVGLTKIAASPTTSGRDEVFDETTGVIDYKKKTDKPLPLNKEPLPITIYKINGKLFVDPTYEEEKAHEARLTVASDSNGIISAMQKGGSNPLSIGEISEMVELSLEKSNFLRDILHKSLEK